MKWILLWWVAGPCALGAPPSPERGVAPSSADLASDEAEAEEADLPYGTRSVVEVPGLGAEEIYAKASVWMAGALGRGGHALELQDRQSRVLVGRGEIAYRWPTLVASATAPGVIRYVVKVEAKEGRYRITISDFVHDNPGRPAGAVDLFLPRSEVVEGVVTFGLITQGETPTREACAAMFGGCGSLWHRNVFANMREVARDEAFRLHEGLKKVMLQPVVDDAW